MVKITRQESGDRSASKEKTSGNSSKSGNGVPRNRGFTIDEGPVSVHR